jgi:hypothetical protein
MGKTRIPRRQLLLAGAAGAGAVGALAVTGAPAVRADSGEDEEGIVGAWLFTVKQAHQPDVFAVVAFATGGVLVEGDLGGPPGSRSTPGIGAWEKHGDTIRAKFVVLSDDGQGNVSKVTITGTIKLNGSDALSGSGTITIAAFPSGSPVFVDHAPQTFTGTRIELDED